MSDENFLSRWSKRKHADNRGEAPPEPALPKAALPEGSAMPAAVAEPPPLPDVASLTHESDFTGFMREGVPEPLKRQALKTLFQDPRFNVMDGLDVYIDDFSKPDPLPEGWLEKMNQVARLGEYREPEPKAPEATEMATEEPSETLHETSPDASDVTPASPVPPDTGVPPVAPPEVPES
jgi:hypothetical protein